MRISDKGPSYPQLHMSTTKTSQQLAEELARKCAKDLFADYGKEIYYKQILQSIPLVELLECTRKLFNVQRDYRRQYSSNLKELNTLSTPHDEVLTNLTTKLHQLGIEI